MRIILLLFLISSSFAEELGVLERYPTFRTIAGSSLQRETNAWIPAFEGADPKSVELSNPHDCGTDVFGRVYIVDKQSHSILRVSADGSTIVTVAGTHSPGNGSDSSMAATQVALNNPNGLHVLADGTFYILDTDNRKIRRVSPSGLCSTIYTHPAGFGAGRGLWVSETEQTIYFCGPFLSSTSQQVMQWQSGIVTQLATLPPGENGLGNIDVAPNQSVGITSVGDHRVYRVTNGGTPVVIAGNGQKSFGLGSGNPATSVALERVRGIAFLPDGSYFLATQKGGDVWWVDLSGNIHLFVNGSRSGNNVPGPDGTSRTSPGDKISEPRAIHLASNNDLLITSNDNGRITAVNTSCHPVAPKATISPAGITFKGTYQGSFILEQSDTIQPDSWLRTAVFTTIAPTTQTIPLPLNQPHQFWRFRVPHLAGGS